MQPTRLKVLVLDDSPEDREMVRRYLTRGLDVPFDVVEAETGAEGLERFGSGTPDAILLDFHLPDMNGLQLIRKLREGHPNLPVIFATGDLHVPGSEGLDQASLITKPYDYDFLAARIRDMVGRNR